MKSAECPLRCHVSLMLIPESSPPPTELVSNLTPESDLAPGVVRPSRRAHAGPPAGCSDAAAVMVVPDESLGFLRLVLLGRRLVVELTAPAAPPPANFNDDS